MVVSYHQNIGQNDNLLTANKSSENVVKFKYVGTIVTNQNCIHEEIEVRLNAGNAYYHSFQSPLSSCLFLKNLDITIYKTIILIVFCMGVKCGLSH
jgi:hypothetical protein